MRKIKAEDGKLYEVPVILIISDADRLKLRERIFDYFFKAVERVYGVGYGWGRKGYQWVYVDEWNTLVDTSGDAFYYAHPVGDEYRQQYAEILQKAVETGGSVLRTQMKIHSTVPQSAFPLPYLLQYAPTTQLATNDVPRDEQWKLMAYMIRQFHRKRAWIDAVFVDAVNQCSCPEDSYDASAIPPVLENLPVTIFNLPEHLTELLIKDKVFLSVKEFTLPTKK